MVLYRVSYINHCQDFRRKVGVRGEGGGGKGESEGEERESSLFDCFLYINSP